MPRVLVLALLLFSALPRDVHATQTFHLLEESLNAPAVDDGGGDDVIVLIIRRPADNSACLKFALFFVPGYPQLVAGNYWRALLFLGGFIGLTVALNKLPENQPGNDAPDSTLGKALSVSLAALYITGLVDGGLSGYFSDHR